MSKQYKVKYIVGAGIDLFKPLASGVGSIHAGIAYDVTPAEYSRLLATGHFADASEKEVVAEQEVAPDPEPEKEEVAVKKFPLPVDSKVNNKHEA